MSGIRRVTGTLNYENWDFRLMGRRAMPVVGRLGIQRFVRSFQTAGNQTDASRGGWRPRRTSRRNPILVDTGRLFRSVKIRSQRYDRVMFGTTGVPYARYHNDGTERLPQREFIGDSQEFFKQIEKILDKNIKRLL